MDFFLRGYGALQSDTSQEPSGPETIERICDNISSSTQLEVSPVCLARR